MAKLLYSAKDMMINDSWYAKENGKFYAYYLQYPKDGNPGGKWSEQTVGLSVSEDLKNWSYLGTVLKAEKGTWCDKGIATGSNVKLDDEWYMLYTGNGYSGEDGLGLAKSTDLIHFKRVGNQPVVPRKNHYYFPYQNEQLECKILADPYIYPEAVGGWYYVFINCYAVNREIGKRGCIAVMRTRNLVNYQPYSIAYLSDTHDRLETPQVFFLNGKWLMYLGGVFSREKDGVAEDYSSESLVLVSDNLTSGYDMTKGSKIMLPDGQYFYIGKVVSDNNWKPIFLVNVYPEGVYGPYSLTYSETNGITVTII